MFDHAMHDKDRQELVMTVQKSQTAAAKARKLQLEEEKASDHRRKVAKRQQHARAVMDRDYLQTDAQLAAALEKAGSV